MKQRLVVLIWVILFSLSYNAALCQTSCPPKKSFFKEKKQRGPLIKLPERAHKEKTVKIIKEPKSIKEKVVKADKTKREKMPDYRIDKVRTAKMKMRKVKAGNYASTKCPH